MIIKTNPTAFMALTTGSNDSILYSSDVANRVMTIPMIQIKEVFVILRRDLVNAS